MWDKRMVGKTEYIVCKDERVDEGSASFQLYLLHDSRCRDTQENDTESSRIPSYIQQAEFSI